ncbi:MAG: aminotransferase class III-fold pyridoxal phosphate-dependent enzyme [Candidatus Micrarchaeaceae archaeon]|jgi:4-aminobutyrate aminotransferase
MSNIKSEKIIKRDKKIFLTTTRAEYNFVADHGEGDFIYDADNNKKIDFSSFISVYNLGVNANAEIRTAIKKQVDKLMHAAFTDYYSELPVSFGEDLIKMFPNGFGKMFLSNSGTEANEAAIKFSKIFTKRQYILAFYNSFHGRTIGSVGLTASKAVQRAHFGPFNGVVHAPYPYPYRCLFNRNEHNCGEDYLDFIKEYILKKEIMGEELAAIILEPIQGEGGYIVPPASFIKGIRKIANENKALLISDEVQSGYMRTGKFLALDNFGVSADIYTMAKALGSGLPIGATIVRNSLGDLPEGAHSNTFGGNHVSIAAAHASLKYLMKNKKELEIKIKKNGNAAIKRLNEMKEKYEIIGDVRGIGLMIGVEIVKNKRTKEHGVKEREKLLEIALKNGLLMLPCGESTIRIIPPLTISETNIEKGLDIFEKSTKETS